jgi:hypothetical protein
VVAAVVVAITAAVAGATSSSNDAAVARAGLLVSSDLPAGFRATAPTTETHADNIRLAKGVDGCGPYVTLQRALASLPQAKSSRYDDGDRTVGNEVDVFPSERAAAAALVLYAKTSVVGCLENLFEKQARLDPDLHGSSGDLAVNLYRQDIAGLGDDSVVYEGHATVTGTDGPEQRQAIGSVAVRVGRAVDVVMYRTQGIDLTDVLTPAIDGSVARLRAALARGRS